MLSFTSGSTGEPKPVTRSHGFLRQQMAILQPVARFEVDDVDFVAMPMFVLFNLANGITSVLPACDIKHPGRADSRVIAEQLRSEGATRTVASPGSLSPSLSEENAASSSSAPLTTHNLLLGGTSS